MRILLASPWFSRHTGYIENGLPKALASLGHEVVVVTSAWQPGYMLPNYQQDYAPFMGAPQLPLGEERIHGVRVVRLPHVSIRNHIALRGLKRVVVGFQPHVVQTFSVNTPLALQLAYLRSRMGFRLFLGAHLPAVAQRSGPSLLRRTRLKTAVQFFTRWLPGRLVSNQAELCYAVTDDCAMVAQHVNGVPRAKLKRASLGVDTSVYHPPTDAALRSATRLRYGFAADEIVCVYSGRFDEVKNPALLAEAVGILRNRGERFRCLFIGGGVQEDILRRAHGVVVLPLMSQESLAEHFRASDIAVWPFGYSSSQLDALACGLPLVLSDAIDDTTRVDGSGAVFKDGDATDLAHVLSGLGRAEARSALGRTGAERVAATLSWRRLAEERCADYAEALQQQTTSASPASHGQLVEDT